MLWFVRYQHINTGPSIQQHARAQLGARPRSHSSGCGDAEHDAPCQDVTTNQRHRNTFLLDWRRVLPTLLEYPHQKLALQVVVLEAVPLSVCHILRTSQGPRSAPRVPFKRRKTVTREDGRVRAGIGRGRARPAGAGRTVVFNRLSLGGAWALVLQSPPCCPPGAIPGCCGGICCCCMWCCCCGIGAAGCGAIAAALA